MARCNCFPMCPRCSDGPCDCTCTSEQIKDYHSQQELRQNTPKPRNRGCIKTGAFVLFEEYGYATAADLFACGDEILVQWNVHGRYYDDFPRTISHRVRIGDGYHHEDRGVTVVPKTSITACN